MTEMKPAMVLALAALVAATVVTAAPVGSPAPGRLVTGTPDLTIANATAERLGVQADGRHHVRITAVARCGAPVPMTCGAFKILAGWLDLDPSTGTYSTADIAGGAGFTNLGEAGVASLSSGSPASATIPTAVRTFDDYVPSGHLRQYRLVADSSNMIAESNETNNVRGVRYRAITCPGSDIVLTKVELIRDTRGGTLVHVWIRNACSQACVADLVYTIDEHEAVPGGTGVEQGIGPRLDGDVTAGPLGNVLAAGLAGHDATYTVAVEARGGTCHEVSTANNSCRVTIRAGEASRVFTCNP